MINDFLYSFGFVSLIWALNFARGREIDLWWYLVAVLVIFFGRVFNPFRWRRKPIKIGTSVQQDIINEFIWRNKK